MFAKCSFAVLFVLLVAGADVLLADQWGYENEDAWSGVCRAGREQSPVNLAHQMADETRLPPLQLHGYSTEFDIEAINTGHSLAAKFLGGTRATALSAGLPHKYILDSLHLHWGGSEHTVASTRYPLELHLVHYADVYRNLSHALSSGSRQALAVVGVLFETVNECEGDGCLDAAADSSGLWSSWREVRDKGEGASRRVQLQPSKLVPSDLSGWWRYEGSLTTPGCNEQVIWTILTRSGGVTPDTLAQLSAMPQMANNYRRLQPLNGRKLMFRPADNNSSASIKSITFLLLPLLSIFTGYL